MGNCKDCRWWDKDDTRYDPYRDCLQIEAGDWQKDGKLAYVHADGIWWNAFKTQADFGCTLFEPREVEA